MSLWLMSRLLKTPPRKPAYSLKSSTERTWRRDKLMLIEQGFLGSYQPSNYSPTAETAAPAGPVLPIQI